MDQDKLTNKSNIQVILLFFHFHLNYCLTNKQFLKINHFLESQEGLWYLSILQKKVLLFLDWLIIIDLQLNFIFC